MVLVYKLNIQLLLLKYLNIFVKKSLNNCLMLKPTVVMHFSLVFVVLISVSSRNTEHEVGIQPG